MYPESIEYATNTEITVDIMNLFSELLKNTFLMKNMVMHNLDGAEEWSIPLYPLWEILVLHDNHELAHQWFGNKITCGAENL